MNATAKLDVLAAAARYDVSCASSGSRRPRAQRGVGATSVGGICHTWSADGRCVSLLKVLFSNHCIYDCAYCVNRASNPVPRATFTVDELVALTMAFYRRNYIEGLFLSSGVLRSPDYTMECMIRVAERLRRDEQFGGYIHLKAIPGASPEALQRAGRVADRVSVNIELPSEVSLRALAPDKRKEDILGPMRLLSRAIADSRAERRRHRRAPAFAPAGQSTQLIVGASPESDRQILTLSNALYQTYGLKRVYYSAYAPVNDDPRLPHPERPDLAREHRLYQADWLLRCYGFELDELLPTDAPALDADLDPKTAWALRHPERFPVDINRAPYETLLRVPGIGVRTASRIVATRRVAIVKPEDLPRLGAVLRRARHFVICSGRYLGDGPFDPVRLRVRLSKSPDAPTETQGLLPLEEL